MGRRGKNKCFIPKNSGTTFRLEAKDEDPERIDPNAGKTDAVQESREERQKYGIYYADDYNYLQHLRDVKEGVDLSQVERTVIKLPPSQVHLPSTILEIEGVEYKIEEQPGHFAQDFDPDIAAALLDGGDADEGDELEDDFIQKATGGSIMEVDTREPAGSSEVLKKFGLIRNKKIEFEDEEDDDEEFSSDEEDGQLDWHNRKERSEKGSHSTSTSAVGKKNEDLTRIDEHFEAIYAQYDETGAGDEKSDSDDYGKDDSDEGDVAQAPFPFEPNSEQLQGLVDEGQRLLAGQKFHLGKPDEAIKQRIIQLASTQGGDSKEELERILVPDRDRGEKWDCESILSTYSTLYNHPTLIREEGRAKKRERKATAESNVVEAMDYEEITTSVAAPINSRSKDETPEEKRARKHAVKEQRQLRRVEKKANQLAFKEESKEIVRQGRNYTGKVRPIA